jgi:hypothetical protein
MIGDQIAIGTRCQPHGLNLHIESEIDDISVFHFVRLAFQPQKPFSPGSVDIPCGDKIIK